MSTTFNKVSAAVAVTAVAVNLVASKFALSTLLSSAGSFVGRPEAGPADYLTVATVFMATLPVVAAAFGSMLLIAHQRDVWSHLLLWFAALLTSNFVLPAPHAGLAMSTTTTTHLPGRWGAAVNAGLYLFRWFDTAYGVTVLAQGVIVGAAAALTLWWCSERWPDGIADGL